MHVCVVGEARDVDVGVARLHFVKGEVVRQNALVGGKGAALVASFARLYKGVAVRGLYRGVCPPALLRGEPGVEHPPCAKLHAGGAERAVGAVEPDGAGLAVDQAGHRYKPGLVLTQSVERGLKRSLVVHGDEVVRQRVRRLVDLVPDVGEVRQALGAVRAEGEYSSVS